MRETKKSESIEIRLPYESKSEFMAYCRKTERTASGVIRDLIDAELGRCNGSKRRPRRTSTFVSAGLAATLLIALSFAAPSSGSKAAGPDFRPVFNELDHNGDGILDAAEYGPMPPSGSNCKADTFVVPLAHEATPKARGQRGFALLTSDVSFERIDWDRDRRITFEEYSSNWTRVLRTGFLFLDADRNGSIDTEEYQRITHHRYRPGTVRPMVASFAELDRNQDRKVSWAEFTT